MEAIRSGTTPERRTRCLLATVACLAFAAWFAYDGWVGWPKDNIPRILENLPGVSEDELRLDPAIDKEARARLTAGMSRAEIEETLGEPMVAEDDKLRYAGPTGVLIVPLSEGRYDGQAQWAEAAHSDFGIFGQKAIAVVLALGGVASLVMLVRVQQTQVVLDDRGLSYNRQPVITWDAMTGLDTSEYDRKGWVVLKYRTDGGEQSLKLDSYRIAEFDAIVDAICQRKGFENPLPVESASGGAADEESPESPKT